MNQMQKRIAAIVAAIAVVLLAVLWLAGRSQTAPLGHGGPLEQQSYDAIGSASTPSTLTTAYNGASSTVISAEGLPNVAISGTYTPNSYGSVAYILLERSTDGGATFYPYQTLTSESSDVLVNTNGTSTTNGSPFLVPGNALFTSASGTAVLFSFDVSGIADFWRVRVKESTTSTAGTMNVRFSLQSN